MCSCPRSRSRNRIRTMTRTSRTPTKTPQRTIHPWNSTRRTLWYWTMTTTLHCPTIGCSLWSGKILLWTDLLHHGSTMAHSTARLRHRCSRNRTPPPCHSTTCLPPHRTTSGWEPRKTQASYLYSQQPRPPGKATTVSSNASSHMQTHTPTHRLQCTAPSPVRYSRQTGAYIGILKTMMVIFRKNSVVSLIIPSRREGEMVVCHVFSSTGYNAVYM